MSNDDKRTKRSYLKSREKLARLSEVQQRDLASNLHSWLFDPTRSDSNRVAMMKEVCEIYGVCPKDD